ncbi:MAG: hypothetical protein PHV16_02715 [Candidatus Nanoarchaeia archaeon]|nr:hypothetical protein [Candidatus Nanoarchaeia archaeon]
MKNKFLVRIILIIIFIIIFSSHSNAQKESAEPETIKPADIHLSTNEDGEVLEITGISYNQEGDYNFNVQNSKGSTTLTQDYLKGIGVKTFTAKNIGTINIENSIESIKSIYVNDGNAKINFMDGTSSATFEINGKGYTFHSDGGYVEWKDGAIFLSKDTQMFTVDNEFNEIYVSSNSENLKISVENGKTFVIMDGNTDVFLSDNVLLKDEKGNIIKSIYDNTHIKVEQGIPIVIKGKISVDYKTSPFKINLYGTYTSLELNTEEGEKFEFTNTDSKNNLLVTISSIDNYMFHDGCTTNCISYRDMGKGHSGELWEKIKVDGNTKIVKYKDDEIGYSLTFSDGKATIGRKYLASMRDIPFNKKTVINYNNGDIELTSFTSQEDIIAKRVELNEDLGKTLNEIRQASRELKEKEEEFERLKKEEGYDEKLPEQMPEDLKQVKTDFENAQLTLDSLINKKNSLISQIADVTDTSLLIRREETEKNINVLNLNVKETYDYYLEKIWLSTTYWIGENKEIYDVDIARTFPNFPYIDEEIIYESREKRFDLYN